MTDLAEKYRPHGFAAVVGQEQAITKLRAQLGSSRPQPVLISGAAGSGKNTLGLIYAKALLCAQASGVEACGSCGNCNSFVSKTATDYTYFPVGETSTVDDVLGLIQKVKLAPWEAKHRVALLDEVHDLSTRAFEALLSVLEAPPRWSTFILLTNKPKKIPDPILQRLVEIQVHPLTPEIGTRYLQTICDAEGLESEPEALLLIHAATEGSPRKMLRIIEAVRSLGRISEENVRQELRLDVADALTAYSQALVEGDLQRQIDVIDSWRLLPSDKCRLIHHYMTFVYFNIVRRIERPDAIMRGFRSGMMEDFSRFVEAAQDRLDVEKNQIWQDVIGRFGPSGSQTAHQLMMIVSSVHDMLSAPQIPRGRISPKPILEARLRVAQPPARTVSNAMWRSVKAIWDAGSFLPQQYGALFNVRLSIYHKGTSERDHVQGSQMVSDLTHQIGMRLADRWPGASKGKYHWIYRHEADGEGRLVTRLLIAVPDMLAQDVITWMNERFFSSRRNLLDGTGFSYSYRLSGSAAARLRFHWYSIRILSRTLDPQVTARGRDGDLVPLVDLLNIPRRLCKEQGQILCQQARGSSHSLGPNRKKYAAADFVDFLSALNDRAWAHIDIGWELDEHVSRKKETERRARLREAIRAKFQGHDKLTVKRLAEEMANLKFGLSNDPKQMLRGWQGWWAEVKK
jgi:DNA polymerase-3 subunit gamma/tau